MASIARRARRSAAGASFLTTLLFGGLTGAQAADRAQIELGIQVYRGPSECEFCHGWTGTGGAPNDEPPTEAGPPMVASKLTREQMIEIVACGVPGGKMPQFLAAAWTEQRRCYGKLSADVPPAERSPRPVSVLAQAQIEAVVAFIQEVYQGKTMNWENCILYYGAKSAACDLYR